MQQIIGFPKEFVGFMHVWEMSAFMQSWGQLVANLSSPGAMLVLLWAILGPTSSILGPTWAQIRRTWCLLGLLRSHLTVNLGKPSATWSRSKGIWNRFGANLSPLAVNWIGSWHELGPSWMQTHHAECNQSLFSIGNLCIFGIRGRCRPSCNLGANLYPTWAYLAPSWSYFGPSWAQLRPSWGQLGYKLGYIGAC